MTSLRSLLVHVDSSPRTALRVRAARQLAELHEAELHGLGGWLKAARWLLLSTTGP